MADTTTKFDQIKYQTAYNKEHYDTLGLMLPKGMKSVIKDYAKSAGVSVTKYVVEAIEFYHANNT